MTRVHLHIPDRQVHLIAGLLVFFGVIGIIYAQTTTKPTASPITTTPLTTSRGRAAVTQIPQPAEFLALAEKAKKHSNVYIEGIALVSGKGTKKIPPAMRKIGIKIWLISPRMRIRYDSPDHQQRVSDGKYSYLLRFDTQGKLICQRKRITKQNLYQTLLSAALFVDATNGYENLTSAVRFKPVAGVDVSKEARKMKIKLDNLKWYLLIPAGKTVHPIVNGWKSTVGVSKQDGLVRILRGEKKIDGKNVAVTYLFKVVQERTVKDKDLKLPLVAAGATWVDVDTGKTIVTPSKIISNKTSD